MQQPGDDPKQPLIQPGQYQQQQYQYQGQPGQPGPQYQYQGQPGQPGPQYQYQQSPPQGYPPPQAQYQYQQQQPYPPQGGYAPSHPVPVEPVNADKFSVPDSAWRDKWWALLFYVHLIGVGVIAGIYYSEADFSSDDDDFDDEDISISSDDVQTVGVFLLVACATAAVFASAWMAIMKQYAESLIWFTLTFSIVMMAVGAIASLAAGQLVLAIVLLVFLAFNCLWVYLVRHRIPFSTALLKGVVDCVRAYPAMVSAAYVCLVLQIVWLFAWGFTSAVVYSSEEDYEEEMDSTNSLLGVFLILSLFWTAQVIANVLQVTVAGTVGTWYFQAGSVENPTWKAFKRAVTTSFGSICLGSLIVAIIKTMRVIVQNAKNQAMRDRNNAGAVVCLAILECLIRWLDSLVQIFNSYAYTYCALYGRTFVQAAKDTWQLIKSRGIEALINDSLIDGVLVMGSFLGGIITALVSGLWYSAWDANDTSDTWIVFAILGFILGFLIVMLAMGVVANAVIAFFVCYAEDPEALARVDPALHSAMTAAQQAKLGGSSHA